jgi:hypothetical protein
VGQYSIKAGVDHRQIKAGEPVELTVEIRGKGNLKTLPTPQLPSLENFKAFEPEVQEETSKASGTIGGTKAYVYVLIPKEQGSYRIDAIDLAYFDPADKSYHMASTEPIEIEVLPGDREEYPLAVGLGREEIKLVGRDIRYIKPAVATLKNQSGYLYGNRAFQISQVIPLLAVLAAFVARKRRDRISRDIRYARWRRAMRRAREGLRSTKKLIQSDSSAQFYGILSKTLCDYVGDKLNLAASGITSQRLREELGRRKADDTLVEEILDCLSTCDYSRFAPAADRRGDMETMLRRVSDLIARLEKSGL